MAVVACGDVGHLATRVLRLGLKLRQVGDGGGGEGGGWWRRQGETGGEMEECGELEGWRRVRRARTRGRAARTWRRTPPVARLRRTRQLGCTCSSLGIPVRLRAAVVYVQDTRRSLRRSVRTGSQAFYGSFFLPNCRRPMGLSYIYPIYS